MKKNLLFGCLMAIVLAFSSCSSEDTLVGTWEIYFLSQTGCDDPEENFTFDFTDSDCIDIMGFSACLEGTLTFTETESTQFIKITTGGFTVLEETSTGTYTSTETSFTVCDSNQDCTQTNYSFDGGDLIITGDAEGGCSIQIKARK